LQEKGWKVAVEWKMTPFGVGLFAAESIPSGTVLRQGVIGRNLLQFRKQGDIESFCRVASNDEMEYRARLKYVSDYLWGFHLVADEKWYPYDRFEKRERFFGMWIPGNGLNHNNEPNTVYVPHKNTDTDLIGINLVALGDIKADEELYDDYRRHGSAPKWLRDFAIRKEISLNFAECNDFVSSASSDKEEKPVSKYVDHGG
jgi:SET domain-containing protein